MGLLEKRTGASRSILPRLFPGVWLSRLLVAFLILPDLLVGCVPVIAAAAADPKRSLELNLLRSYTQILPPVGLFAGSMEPLGTFGGSKTLTHASPFQFGVDPGGATGSNPSVPNPSPSAVNQHLHVLAGNAPFLVHLYTAWSWYDPAQLDSQVNQFGQDGFKILLTAKYSPPSGHNGDVAGYQAFLRSVVDRYATNPAVLSIVVGNEPNVYGDPNSSDGPFLNSHRAIALGVIAARAEIKKIHSSTRVGFNFAVTGSGSDGAFLNELAQIGGSQFTSVVQFIGIDLYPGIWPVGLGTPYANTQYDLAGARASVNSVQGLNGRPIDIVEIGTPVVNEQDQASQLAQIFRATLDNYIALNISSFNWFDLWDANSQSSDPLSHYGLLRSDLSEKPAFYAYQGLIAANPLDQRNSTEP